MKKINKFTKKHFARLLRVFAVYQAAYISRILTSAPVKEGRVTFWESITNTNNAANAVMFGFTAFVILWTALMLISETVTCKAYSRQEWDTPAMNAESNSNRTDCRKNDTNGKTEKKNVEKPYLDNDEYDYGHCIDNSGVTTETAYRNMLFTDNDEYDYGHQTIH